MSTKTIMVQFTTSPDGLKAFHHACRAARTQDLSVIVVCMMPVQHLSWLGSDVCPFEIPSLHREGKAHAAIAKQYGVQLRLLPFQYYSLPGAIVDAADFVDAKLVFAALPHSRLPLVNEFQTRLLRKRLSEHGRELAMAGDDEELSEAAAD